MKKMILVLLALAVVFLTTLPAPAIAEKYVVKPGDCLCTIAQRPSVVSTWWEIAKINELKPPYTIHPKKTLVLITDVDLAAAWSWCESKLPGLGKREGLLNNANFFRMVLRDIEGFKSSIPNAIKRRMAHSGVYLQTILYFAESWRRKNTGKCPGQGPGTRQIF